MRKCLSDDGYNDRDGEDYDRDQDGSVGVRSVEKVGAAGQEKEREGAKDVLKMFTERDAMPVTSKT